MPSQVKFPGTAVDDNSTGTVAWSNASRVTASDDSRASVTLNGQESHYIKATNFSFSIPSNATLTSIVVGIEAQQDGSVPTGGITDGKVRLVKAGTIQGTDGAGSLSWANSDVVRSHTFAVTGFTPADINDSGFGTAFSGIIGGGPNTGQADSVQITVTYTLPGDLGDIF